LRERILGAKRDATWLDFPDVAAIYERRVKNADLRRLRAFIEENVDVACGVDANACIFADRRRRMRLCERRLSPMQLVHLLCDENANDRDRISTLCACPSATFTTAGCADTRSTSNLNTLVPLTELACINPAHFYVVRFTPERQATSAVRKKRKLEFVDSTYVITPGIEADHVCQFLDGDPAYRRQLAPRKHVPMVRQLALLRKYPIELFVTPRNALPDDDVIDNNDVTAIGRGWKGMPQAKQ